MDTIKKILSKFDSLTLSQIEGAKLMDRIDRKYWFHISNLEEILEKIIPYYNILEINGQRVTDYETTYFDTTNDLLYKLHHNEKLNRYKIRRRKYISTGIDFLEIKLKSNKQRTIKKRIESKVSDPGFTSEELMFIGNYSPFRDLNLYPALSSRFQRITLVNKSRTDRCTFDLNIGFENNTGGIILDNLVVVEIKREKNLKSSPLLILLKEKKIRQPGLSKYCIGRAILDPGLKQNLFKPRLMFLKKEILNHVLTSN